MTTLDATMQCHSVLVKRAHFLKTVRRFLDERGVLEVDVPALSRAAVTDPNIECLQVQSPLRGNEHYFLMPSPEFYLKRLLVRGSGSLYSLGHAYRAGERGTRHQPEFALLEWYRPGWSLLQLRQEVEALVSLFLDLPVQYCSYADAFKQVLCLDPYRVSLSQLQTVAQPYQPAFESDDKSVWLDFLFSHAVEPRLQGLVFVDEFPACQAALAKTAKDAQGNDIGLRFELYVNGIEIANAYCEETDVTALSSRFSLDLAIRQQRGQYTPAVDVAFLTAMQQGMPDCAGVALGVDRLFMLSMGRRSLVDVLPFWL